jgi:hypothetical protein
VVPDVFGVVIDNLPVPPDFQVAFFHIQDDVEVFISTPFFADHGPKHIFQNTHHRGAVNILEFGKLRERFNQN